MPLDFLEGQHKTMAISRVYLYCLKTARKDIMSMMSPNVPSTRIHATDFWNFTPEKSLSQPGKISITDMKDKGIDILYTEKLS